MWEGMSVEDAAANLIRSHLGTLNRHLSTSMRLHNVPKESTKQLAATLSVEVDTIASTYRDSEIVLKWQKKFREYCDHHRLL